MNSKLFLLLCVLLALQFTAFAYPSESVGDIKAIADNKPPKEKRIIPPNHLPKYEDEDEDESGVYSAQLSSSEIDLPCTNETIRVQFISSSIPFPERFFHLPKRCSEEVQ
nr:uncharacterized protein LOC106625142 [Bactrocera oleae]